MATGDHNSVNLATHAHSAIVVLLLTMKQLLICVLDETRVTRSIDLRQETTCRTDSWPYELPLIGNVVVAVGLKIGMNVCFLNIIRLQGVYILRVRHLVKDEFWVFFTNPLVL